ncbi:helix-turn-helix transcriptional regulator [Virgibacillus sp. YIM 98842]|uniref:helix-turn-helix transcriptional regulator n=1 Tax=Virgibacillus sp. YIM 98842 TaxID=2663533 RepID=UPI0013D96278|nr:helix-turn-helix transcriptional regulator [Virgibacillus sp. YIM 98842]
MIVLKSRAKFNEIIAKKGYSKRSFARKSGLAESTFIQISNGKQSPRPDTAKKICDALQLKFDDVFTIEAAKKKVS